MFCEFKDVLGEPNKGFHSARLFGMARNDLLGTVFIAIICAIVFNVGFIYSFILIFALGFILHLLFCVETAFVKKIKKYVCPT